MNLDDFTRKASLQEITVQFQNPNIMNIILCTWMNGTRKLINTIEYDVFPPGTERNDDLTLTLLTHGGMDYWIVSIPIDYRPNAFELAKEQKMVLINQLYKLNKNTPELPFRGETSYMLMYGKDHEAAWMDAVQLKEAWDRETKEIERRCDAHERRLKK